MTYQTFEILLWVMCILALVVFISLYFVKAGYGIFRTKNWGYSVNNKIGWVLMEAPVFIVMLWLWVMSPMGFHLAPLIFFIFFELHYFQRSFIFPFLMRGRSKMPILILLMGVVFNVLNGIIQAEWLFYLCPENLYTNSWLVRPNFIIGTLLFFLGMGINLHSDWVIRHLRKKGDTHHYLPQKGMYSLVTSGNYFGELLEWTGFAILTLSPAAWVFVLWTFANLAPRAHAIRNRYKEEFGDNSVGKRKRLIPFIY